MLNFTVQMYISNTIRIVVVFLLTTQALIAQNSSFHAQTLAFRSNYKHELNNEARSPVHGADTNFLRFFKPNARYRVRAAVKLLNSTDTVVLQTVKQKQKQYLPFAILNFEISGKPCSLYAYRNVQLLNDSVYGNSVFIPFTDLTTYNSTHGGGRYIDIPLSDFETEFITLDFNRAHNPYCAYGGSYNCTIPPNENKLAVAIKAGEKKFGKKIESH